MSIERYSAGSLEGRSALVTGAGGFIGSHLVEALLARGVNVTALVRYTSTGTVGFLEECARQAACGVRLVRGDLADADVVNTAVAGQDFVFHLGALIGIPYSYEAPQSYVRTNVIGTLNVLEAVRRQGVGRLVHTSTSEVYGSAQYTPIDEAHPLQAQSPYAASKIAADKLAESYVRSFEVPVVTLRPFNTYGPRQSMRAVIPTVIQQVLRGDRVRLGATRPVRDMSYVDDTVEGFLAAAVTPDIEGGVYNLGMGQGHSVGDIASRILALCQSRLRVESDPDRFRPESSEVDRLVSNHDAFTRVSGWRPRVSLDDGLQRTIDWIRDAVPPVDVSEYAR